MAHQRREPLGVARDVARGFLGPGRTQLRLGFLHAARPVVGIAHPLPFLQQAGIHLPDHRAEKKFHLAQGVVLRCVGHRLREHLVHAGEVPQEQAFRAL